MSTPIFTICEINDGGDPDTDIDTTVVRCLQDGVETKITQVIYSGSCNATHYKLSTCDRSAEFMSGEPCSPQEWASILAEFKAAIGKLPC